MADHPASDETEGLLRKIGLELAFLDLKTAADTATLARLLEAFQAATAAAPPELPAAAAVLAGWLAGEASRPADLTAAFSEWHAWASESLTAWRQDRALPPLPALLEHATVGPLEPPAADATRWQPPGVEAAAEDVPLLPTGSDPEMIRLFCTEAEELLADIEQSAIVLETDAETLATLFRSFHTLKGNAAVMKLAVLQRLAHEVESLLDAARRGRRPLDRDAIDVVLAAADLVTRAVSEMNRQLDGQQPGRSIPLPVAAVIDRVHVVLASPSRRPAAPPPSAPPAAATPAPPAPPPPRPAPKSSDEPRPPAEPAPPAAKPAGPSPPRPARGGSSVRVDTGKLDSLVDLVGELVISESMVFQAAEAAGGDEQLGRALGQLRSITADLQRTALAMRMLPIRGTFQKMSRLVRDTAATLGKQIRLVIEGEETELDRTVIEEIGDPLVHMIRNAVDHGIEPPSEREAAGKPARGTVRLRAFHQGGFVVIEIADDGRGLDPARIRAKAVERGLIAPDAQLDRRETLELIFAPGFSTAEQISDLSGRGVGMDVVRRNIERVRGKVEIDSLPGRGTTFTIFMPLTLAIIEGLIVTVAGQRFVIPTLAVRESFRPLAGSIATVQGRGELVDVRGRQLPLLRLGRHLGIGGVEDPCRGIVVVLEAGQDRRCLLVDDLAGKQEVVIKSLGETFASRTAFAGAAILGDGRVGLILDTTPLVRLGGPSTETAA
jgi:two-component system chemotaxis sensor kinase CheA